ncbi:MAG: AAA family ATPase [Myxococcales bacterium]|nr:AAA family ATPase [Myxococcales bacterium]
MGDDNFEDALDRDGQDLVAAAHAGELPPVDERGALVDQVIDLLDRGRPVLLTGPAGVGKTAIVHAVAARFAARRRGALRQMSTTAMMSRTRYIGEWESKTLAVAEAARELDAVLYFSDIWHLPVAGRTSNSPRNMLEALRPLIEGGKLRVLGEAQPELQRQMDKVPGFTALFTEVAVPPLDDDAADRVLQRAAERARVTLDADLRRALFRLTGTFLASRPQPGPALNLLQQVVDHADDLRAAGEAPTIDEAYVEHVFSLYTGLPRFVVSPRVTRPARDIRAWFEDRIVGQSEAIEAVVETIALFKAGLQDPQRPLGTFLFVGPTGVGKTELARALATYLFGSATRLLRFDLSEFKDYHAFEMLLGNPRDPTRPARLVDPVRAQPFQVVLLDELEKAHPNVYDLLLPVLDEGRLTPPGGRTVDFRNTILIATSNVGAQASDHAVGFGATADAGSRRKRILEALESTFRPEFLNRFQHVVVFHPLDQAQVRAVARHELRRILQREGITRRNLVVEIDDAALDVVLARGYDPRYGARALKRELQRQLVLPLAMTLMERAVDPGAILRVADRDGQLRVRVIDTADSRAHRREQAPVEVEPGRKLDGDALRAAVDAVSATLAALAKRVDEPHLLVERDRLVELRAEPDFWRDPRAAARDLRDLDRVNETLDRLDALRVRRDALVEVMAGADSRRRKADAANRLGQLEAAVARATRELWAMGPDGRWDALLEVAPIGPEGRLARDLLVEVYRGWARGRGGAAEWLFEPRDDGEPAMLAVKGPYPFGYLRLEAGLHRVRRGEDHGAARVRLAPWTDAADDVRFGEHRALKVEGQFGGQLRSRLTCDGGLVLQNERSLTANRDLAAEVAPSWAAAAPPSDVVVRRYDLEPFRLRDTLLDLTTGRADVLVGDAFHDLLGRRLDTATQD